MKISALFALAGVNEVTALSLSRTEAHATANPIRRVVGLIQGLQKKVEEDAVTEQKLFDEFMCYCKTGVGTLAESISAAEAKIPKEKAAIEAAEASVKQLRADLKQHKADRASAEASSEKATAIRDKEAAGFATFKSDSETNIAAIKKAVGALEAGAGGSFLQTGLSQTLRQFVIDKAELADVDRDAVMAFLQGGDDDAGPSGQITGILKQMGDTMVAELADATAEEEGSIKNYDGLIAANNKQIEATTVAIEEKSVRVGEVDVQVAEQKGDLKDTEEALAEDQAFLADLQKNCGTKEAEWAETKKMRSEEIIALADTIKILNDDDALEMFKKTLPGSASSFLQVTMSTAATKKRALLMIRAAEKNLKPAQRRLDFIALALSGKKIGLEKVIKMCDSLVVVLKKEQEDDEAKKAYCEKEIDTAEDQKKVLDRAISDAATAIEDAEETIAGGAEEIKALEKGIKDLDKSVDEATEQRTEENTEYKSLMANNGAAKELIGMAKNRMNKFYNPSQYEAPPKRELSEEDRAAQAAGGEFVSISAHAQDEEDVAPPPPPSGPKAYSKKSEESNGVIRMLDMLVQDLDKEMQVAEVDEKNAQEEYEQMMTDSSAKRKESTKQIADMKGGKADAEEALQSHTDTKENKMKENMANDKVLSTLHGECDWMLQYFDVRKEARTSEIEAIGKAKAVLNGADFSLLQTARSLRGVHQ